MNTVDTREISNRSAFHAMAVSLVTQMQQGLERQRRIWLLRAKIEEHHSALLAARAALEIEEKEQQLEHDLAEQMMELIERKADAFALSTVESAHPQAHE